MLSSTAVITREAGNETGSRKSCVHAHLHAISGKRN